MRFSQYFLLAAVGLALSVMTQAVCAVDLSNSVASTYTSPTLGTMPYRVFYPDGYTANSDPVPVILFLHGAGERGNDNVAQVASHVDPLLANAKSKYKAIVIAPQCAPGNQWASVNANDNWGVGAYHNPPAGMLPISNSLQMAMNIFDSVVAASNVDKSRLYITGLSMGGYGTWDAIARFPDKFAAAMPLSGGGNLDSVNAIKNIPIWAYHGVGDSLVPDTGTTAMIAALKAAGGNPYATLAGGKGHSGWSEFYTDHSGKDTFGWYAWDSEDGKFLYPWLFAQTKPVPEPASGLLLPLALVATTACRNRRIR